jgi:hypothetical protein
VEIRAGREKTLAVSTARQNAARADLNDLRCRDSRRLTSTVPLARIGRDTPPRFREKCGMSYCDIAELFHRRGVVDQNGQPWA